MPFPTEFKFHKWLLMETTCSECGDEVTVTTFDYKPGRNDREHPCSRLRVFEFDGEVYKEVFEVKPEPKVKAEYFCFRCQETFFMEGLLHKAVCPNCENKEALWRVS